MKKLLSVVLLTVLILALAIPALAAGSKTNPVEIVETLYEGEHQDWTETDPSVVPTPDDASEATGVPEDQTTILWTVDYDTENFPVEIEINAPGTPIRDALSEIEAVVLEGIGPGDCVVIAGSCPKDVPKPYPSELVGKVKQTGAEAVLDCDGEALRIAVNAPVKPDLIKPNNEELAALTGCSPDDPRELARAAEGLGIPTVITTRAGEDPLLTDERGTISFAQEKRPVVRLKGAGDTFLGAFVYARYVWGDDDMAMEFASIVAGDYVAGK